MKLVRMVRHFDFGADEYFQIRRDTAELVNVDTAFVRDTILVERKQKLGASAGGKGSPANGARDGKPIY